MKGLRVGLVSPVFPHPHGGIYPGIERHAMELSRHLKNSGCDVTIFTTFWNGGTNPDRFNGMPIYRSGDLSQAIGRYGALFDLHYFTWGNRLLEFADLLQECDILHALGPLSCSKSLKSKGIPLVTHFHHLEGVRKGLELLYKPFHWRIEGMAYHNSTLIITPSRSSAQDLCTNFGVPPNIVKVVPHGVDASKFSSGLGREPDDSVRLLFVGGHEPRKGLPYLLEALAYVRKEGLPVRLTLVGQGSQTKDLRTLSRHLGVHQSVEFRGYVPDHDGTQIPGIFAASDIFVLPSLQEGFGFVLLEAMASSLPIVASDLPAIAEVVGDTGILVPPGRPRDLAEAITLLVQDSTLRFELGRSARARVENLFSWDSVTKQVMSLYAEAIELRGKEFPTMARPGA